MEPNVITDCDECGGGVEEQIGNRQEGISFECLNCGATPIKCGNRDCPNTGPNNLAYDYKLTVIETERVTRAPDSGVERIKTCRECSPHKAAPFDEDSIIKSENRSA